MPRQPDVSPLTIEQMQEVLSIMMQMKQMAISHNWQELSRLDSERLALLQRENYKIPTHMKDIGQTGSPSSSPILSENDSTRIELKNRILALDKEILKSLQADRAKLLSENRGLNAQLKAKSVYSQTTSMRL